MSTEASSRGERARLAGYRALDLTDHRGALAGRLLADLGVDVVKVEPPGGEPDRLAPPCAADRPGPTRSRSWLPGNFGKRSVELDLETEDGRATVRCLAAASDFILESFPPGHLAARGLGWEALAREHPALVLTSITALGQTGPRADWKATDLTLMALGGSTLVCGERDRPPVRIGVPQAWYHAGAEAVVATLIAHHGFFVTVEHPVLGPVPLEGHAFRLPACPPAWRSAPLWGEHTERVFGEILGLDRRERERLREAEVIW